RRLRGRRARLRALLRPLGLPRDDAGALLLQDLNDAAGAAVDDRVQQHGRNGDDQTEHRSHQRLGNTGRHHGRVTRAEQRDRLEGLDHARHRAEQTEQRRDDGDHLDEQDAPLQPRHLLQDRLAELQLERLRIGVRVVLIHPEHAAERIVVPNRVALQLRLHLAAGDAEHDEPLDRDQDADDAEGDDHVADDLALLDVLQLVGRLDQQRQELTARDVHAEAKQVAVRRGADQRRRRVHEPTLGRLTLQLRDGAVLGHPQIAAVGDEIEGADADDVLVDFPPVRGDDALVLEPLDLAELRRLTRELVPEPLDLADRRQTAARAGLLDELRQKLVAVGKLDARERALEQRARVAGNLLQHAEQLAQRPQTLVELRLDVPDQQLVVLEGRLELLTARLFLGL